jgi:hypothetical protein
VNYLKSKATIGKTAIGAIAFFTAMRASVNLATFDAVIDNLRALRLVDMLIAPIVIEPKAEE